MIHTVEMHTGGEPVRIVVAGWPEVKGQTIVEKRRYVLEHHDHLRRQLMLEPRGSEGMYGVLLVEPDLPGAAMAALFMHGEGWLSKIEKLVFSDFSSLIYIPGFSTMCGHATISIGRYAIDYGIVKPAYPETHFTLQCPCGPLKVTVQTREGKDGKPVTGAVSYESVPTYVAAPNQKVEVEGRGSVSYDLCFAGTFYAMVNADEVGVDLTDTKTCVSFAGDVTDKLRSTLQISHPENPDLAFVYGTILYRNVEEDGEPCSHQQCVFADRQVNLMS